MSALLDEYTKQFSQLVPFFEATFAGGAKAEIIETDRVRSWSWKMPGPPGVTLAIVVTDEGDPDG
jgi:hypothetical protein